MEHKDKPTGEGSLWCIYIYLYIYIKVQWIKISTVASKNISAVFFAMLISMLIAGRSWSWQKCWRRTTNINLFHDMCHGQNMVYRLWSSTPYLESLYIIWLYNSLWKSIDGFFYSWRSPAFLFRHRLARTTARIWLHAWLRQSGMPRQGGSPYPGDWWTPYGLLTWWLVSH